ncbi:MAG: thioredoxin-dependent thiol peroxidase [Dehalococcoidia bacterium]|nr:thioredoxin-dependent thiol peroxidase [Dehalococcoidia bacterium]
MPALDSEAPDFDLRDQAGAHVRLRDLRGSWVVLYFYPKDDTPGCTKEACNFRDNHAALAEAGAVVVGVSADSEAAHQKFAAKYELPFQLLVDGEHEVARAYGAWGTKNMYGKTYEGLIRSTFIISPDGRVAKVWPKVKPDRHGDEVLAWLREHATA